MTLYYIWTKQIIKKWLLNFIKHHFDEFERLQEISDTPFKNYDHFVKHNKKCLEKLDETELMFLLRLCVKILNKSLMTTDAEDFGEWNACVFYFNKNGKLVIVRPR